MRIFKYPLEIETEQTIELPYGSTILSVINQNDKIVLYAEVHPDKVGYVKKQILIFGTGHDLYIDRGQFLGTVSLFDGKLVFHVYEG